MRRKTLLALGLVALAAVLGACAPNATQDSLDPAGPFARKSHDLFVPVFWVAVGIFVVVEGALVWFAIRYRHRKGREGIPPQVHGNTRLEVAWTILPAVILAGVAVPTVATIFDLAREPDEGVMRVDVLGHQWWWEFSYLEQGFTTANELHIPTGEPVYLRLCGVGMGGSPDAKAAVTTECQPGGDEGPRPEAIGDAVIHSFWVPQLAGTIDVVPGQTNNLWIEADEPGRYSGQCKEFCGLSHAYMKFVVVAHEPAEYETWLQGQLEPASPPEGEAATAGAELFVQRCTACHTVDGVVGGDGEPVPVAQQSNGAPNLTHFMSRECFRGCTMPITEENLRRWLRNPQAVEAGSWMILEPPLTEQEIDNLVAYLQTLR
ncbi:MAG TPA: cytochrome c oxidase subunit II [Actinomycetota bacterium]|nr:cytochrome c oxidase subunit II [Actinomycetota bacterium]